MAQRGGRTPAKYRQIAADLRARIEHGEWPVDEQIPTMEELASRYQAAQGTIDKALGVLRDLGIVETIHGTGTFVRAPAPAEHDLFGELKKLSERVGVLEDRVNGLEGGKGTRR